MNTHGVTTSVMIGVLVLATTAEGQDRWATQARGEMTRAAQIARDAGFGITDSYYHGSLSDSRAKELDMSFSAEHTQVIVAVCDFDCRDIDLALLEPNGREVEADRSVGDTAAIIVPPNHSGRHTVRVSMPYCKVSPCRYELAVFRR